MRSSLYIAAAALLLAMQFGSAFALDDHSESNRKRWQSMSPEQKRQVIENYRAWKSRPPESRQRVERNYETYRGLTSEEKQKLRARYRTYRDLDREGRERLRERLQRAVPPSNGNSQDMTRRIRRMQHITPEERMRRLERSRFWRELSNEEREIYKKLIFPSN